MGNRQLVLITPWLNWVTFELACVCMGPTALMVKQLGNKEGGAKLVPPPWAPHPPNIGGGDMLNHSKYIKNSVTIFFSKYVNNNKKKTIKLAACQQQCKCKIDWIDIYNSVSFYMLT